MRTHRRNRFDGNEVDYSPAKAASERRLRAIFGNRLNSWMVGDTEVGSLPKHWTITSVLVVIRAQSGRNFICVLSGKDATMGRPSPAASLLI
jgi:hypothetical protein